MKRRIEEKERACKTCTKIKPIASFSTGNTYRKECNQCRYKKYGYKKKPKTKPMEQVRRYSHVDGWIKTLSELQEIKLIDKDKRNEIAEQIVSYLGAQTISNGHSFELDRLKVVTSNLLTK